METPQPDRRRPLSRLPTSTPSPADADRVRAWLKLRDETAELHARLVYLKLLLTLGVRRG
jgi:hypothetical protein